MKDESAQIYTAFSRAMYNQTRRDTGCPPVIAVRLRPAHLGWYVEMKDGSFSIDSVSGGVDVWEAKCKCIEGWQEMMAAERSKE